jgi:hypothetical protein
MTKMTNDDNPRKWAGSSSDELLGVLRDAEIYFSDKSGWVHSHSLMAEGLMRRSVQMSVSLAKIAKAYKSQCKESDQRFSIVVGSEKFQANFKETVDGLLAFRAELEKMDSEIEKLTDYITERVGPADTLVEQMASLMAALTGKSDGECLGKIFRRSSRIVWPHLNNKAVRSILWKSSRSRNRSSPY